MGFYDVINLPADQMILYILLNFGWIPIAIVIIWGAKELWIDFIQNKWAATQKFILLAIDIPKDNQQNPKAVESIFIYLLGAHRSFNLVEKYWLGQFQLGFSLEIVSIDGYTQFLIRTPPHFRELVESAFYSQYPDCEITEVNDYTENAPRKFPDDEYDLWGAEFIQVKNYAYPIKTYPEFIDDIGKPEEQFKDPMATLMDLCSSLREGEQLWSQIVIRPIDFSWAEAGAKEISKILKEKQKSSKNIVDYIVDGILAIMGEISETVFSIWGGIEDSKTEEKDDSLKMMNLKPREKKQIEKIQEKVSKPGFDFKFRFIYLAKKEVFNKAKVVSGFVGYMKQFVDLDINNFKPDMDKTATSASYFFVERRLNAKKTKILRNYKSRSLTAGRTPGILNVEELATLWHFPVEAVVKAPLIQKAPGRKSEPPNALPFVNQPSDRSLDSKMEEDIEKDEIFKKEVLGENIENIKKENERKTSKRKETIIDLTQNDDFEPNFDLEEDIDKKRTESNTSPKQVESIKNDNIHIKGAPPENLPFV